MSIKKEFGLFLKQIQKEAEQEKYFIGIKIIDKGKIKKKCKSEILAEFKIILWSAKNICLFFVFRPNRPSFWYSIERGGIAVNLSKRPDRNEWERSVKDAETIDAGIAILQSEG